MWIRRGIRSVSAADRKSIDFRRYAHAIGDSDWDMGSTTFDDLLSLSAVRVLMPVELCEARK